MPERVRIVEVGPRDGLQNEPQAVTVEVKVALIEALADAGLATIEAGSFVSPRWVPQMAGTAEVLAGLRRRPGVSYPVLVPNMQGFEAAVAAGADEIAVFGAASEGFCRRNINCSIAESLERFRPVAKRRWPPACACAATSPACSAARTRGRCAVGRGRVAAELAAMGCYEVSLGDTIGVGTPLKAGRCWRPSPSACLWTGWPCTSTTPMARRWRTSCLPGGRRLGRQRGAPALAAVPTPPGRAATSPPRTSSTCWTAWAFGPGSISHRLLEAGRLISGALGRPPNSKVALAHEGKAARA